MSQLIKFIQIALLTLPLISLSPARASIIGMLTVDPQLDVSFGVEKTASGEFNFRIDLNENTDCVQMVFSAGNAFATGAVTIFEGVPYLLLSIYDGREYGFVNSEKVASIAGASNNRTTQSSSLTQDIIDIANAGQLKDAEGKEYQPSDIKGIVFIYQTPGTYDTSLGSKEILLSNVPAGGIVQLYGDSPLTGL